MAEPRRRAPLEHRAADLAKIGELTGGEIMVEEVAFLPQFDVRTDDPARAGLPSASNTWDDDALWLGPDEWLVIGNPATEVPGAASVVDVSANQGRARPARERHTRAAREGVLARPPPVDMDRRRLRPDDAREGARDPPAAGRGDAYLRSSLVRGLPRGVVVGRLRVDIVADRLANLPVFGEPGGRKFRRRGRRSCAAAIRPWVPPG